MRHSALVHHASRAGILWPIVALAVAAACGGDRAGERAGNAAAATGAADAALTAGGAPSTTFDPTTITPGMLALGDSLYHGLIGATSCQACHGVDGTQATVAPNLVDAEWLHSDGSWEGIYKTIVSGVSTPKQFSSMMPPYGGIPMTEERTRAVAAYVYSLSHK
jgi:mono/diheme cytochrome c family protein